MAEPEPRYVLTFKPGSPEIIVVAIAALVGAGFTIFVSFVVRSLSCGEGFSAMLVIACAGVAPLLGMLVESVRRRGHPWYWFFAAAFVYRLLGRRIALPRELINALRWRPCAHAALFSVW